MLRQQLEHQLFVEHDGEVADFPVYEIILIYQFCWGFHQYGLMKAEQMSMDTTGPFQDQSFPLC